MPEIKYGDHLMHEVENVAWDCTMTGTRRGFWIGLLVGVLVVGIAIGGMVVTGLGTPASTTEAPPQKPEDTREVQAMREELNALWQENQALKKQAAKAAVAVTCPPCRPQETGKGPVESHAATSVSQSAKQGTMTTGAAPKSSVVAPASQVARPPTPPPATTPPRVVLPPTAPTPIAKVETPPPPVSLGLAIVEVRTSQGQLVPGVPIAFRFLDDGNKQIGGATVTTNAEGRSTTAIPSGTACAEYLLPTDYVRAGRVKPEISRTTGQPVAPGLFRTCGAILAHPNGIIGVFTID
jgi:hypothetical protein